MHCGTRQAAAAKRLTILDGLTAAEYLLPSAFAQSALQTKVAAAAAAPADPAASSAIAGVCWELPAACDQRVND